MTIAERVIYEHKHGKGTKNPSSSQSSMVSFAEARMKAEEEKARLDSQVEDLRAKKIRLERELRELESVKNTRNERCVPQNVSVAPGSSAVPSMPRNHQKTVSHLGRKRGDAKQHCVSPWFALKRFFTNWSAAGRSSRSEVWWVLLFIMFPLSVAANIVGEKSGLLMLVGLASLVAVWPLSCLEARRIHDCGLPAILAIALVLTVTIGHVIAAVYREYASTASGTAHFAAFVLLLINVAGSEPVSNQYGDVPNLS